MHLVRFSRVIVLVLVCCLLLPALCPAQQAREISQSRFSFTVNGNTYRIPYYSNTSLSQDMSAIKRIVVVIHGYTRNPKPYFEALCDALLKSGLPQDQVLILAPHFLTEEDVEYFKLNASHVFWSKGGWKIGHKSKSTDAHPRADRISSFAVLDLMLESLTDREQFPSLETIVLAGHSAGGQLVNRYSAGSRYLHGLAEKYRVRCVVANPSSYVYLDNRRWKDHSLARLEVPADAKTQCPKYNEYRYGLEDLNTYMAATGPEAMRLALGRMDTVYLLGEEDTKTQGDLLDSSCEARLQGRHRLERGMLYYAYIDALYAGEHRHRLVIVPGVGHSSRGVFGGDEGVGVIFGF